MLKWFSLWIYNVSLESYWRIQCRIEKTSNRCHWKLSLICHVTIKPTMQHSVLWADIFQELILRQESLIRNPVSKSCKICAIVRIMNNVITQAPLEMCTYGATLSFSATLHLMSKVNIFSPFNQLHTKKGGGQWRLVFFFYVRGATIHI